ncbi:MULTISPECIES: ArdC family protein [Asaia]|uniref:DUF1738 domain-containing protein n=1 Tax=Asaia spathodeae TaxID=657016 RepID=A0ABX2P7Y1_9PROT|nr:zincin-like metallopeptidase domain-containing protein [Asaia spathodeae]GBR20027.1 antirestriction protein ArdC [Asaia spathodeae NBRC 105894]
MTDRTRADLHQETTDRIIAELEKGYAPWVQPWTNTMTSGSLPRNATTESRYSGINVILLWIAGQTGGFRAQRWLTYRQAEKLGGNVRKGEKGTTVFYANRFVPKSQAERDDPKTIAFLKRYTVFNIEQCDGLPESACEVPTSTPLAERHEAAEAVIAATKADIRFGGNKAFYAPTLDYIALPQREAFAEQPAFLNTAFHELAHWSGAEHRLARDLSNRFGTHGYGAEELVAEMTAAFVMAELGIAPRSDHASYIGSWLALMKEDKRAIFTAARLATEAANFILPPDEAAMQPMDAELVAA